MKTHLLFLSFLTVHCVTYQIKEITPVQKEGIPFETKKETGSEENTLPPGVLVIPNKKNTPPVKTPIPLNTQEGDFSKTETPCDDSGTTIFPEEKVSIGFKSRKLSEKVSRILEREANRNLKHCPENCQQKNIYKAFIQIGPISSAPRSCPLPQSKEIYAFQKTFTSPENPKNLKTENKQSEKSTESFTLSKNTKDLKAGGKEPKQPISNNEKNLETQMADWILRTFVYPYIPGVKFTPTEELLSHKIDKACPKCSFYFDYNYFYESDNQLNLDITVRCGDRKKGFGFTRLAKLQVKNEWQCLNAIKEHAIKKHAIKKHVTKKHATKKHAIKKHATKEHATKEHAIKEHVIKEHH